MMYTLFYRLFFLDTPYVFEIIFVASILVQYKRIIELVENLQSKFNYGITKQGIHILPSTYRPKQFKIGIRWFLGFTVAWIIFFLTSEWNEDAIYSTLDLMFVIILPVPGLFYLFSGKSNYQLNLKVEITPITLTINEILMSEETIKSIELWDDLIIINRDPGDNEEFRFAFKARHFDKAAKIMQEINQFCTTCNIPIEDNFEYNSAKNEVIN